MIAAAGVAPGPLSSVVGAVPVRPASSAPRTVPSAAREPSRSTFGVRRALDQLAASLPDKVYQRSEARVRALRSQTRSRSDSVAPVPARPVSAAPDRARPSGLSLDRATDQQKRNDDRCKGRPASNKPNGAGGGSRPFVPWCQK